MLKAEYIHYNFIFNFPGGTSRGVLTQKPSYFLKLWNTGNSEVHGIGEISLIPGLSLETTEQIEKLLNKLVSNPDHFINNINIDAYPALKFGIETALFDLENGGKRIIYPSEFTNGNQSIQINGLVWMGTIQEMLQRIKEKIESGFSCIKIKVGAVDFNDEINLLKHIRSLFSEKDIEIRVDANGAFTPKDALNKLEILSKYKIHSIEQPIKQRQWPEMEMLCKNTPLPIALDEELIGITDENDRKSLLNTIKPQYIIIKPSLIGGLRETQIWSNLANERNIGWWVTSALEGNIGLNAIAQWTFENGSNMPQGLGTGQVFSNNIVSPLEIRGEQLWYNPEINWQNI